MRIRDDLVSELAKWFRPLSQQEKEVLFLLLKGYTLREIMQELGIRHQSSLYTIARRINQKYERTGLI